MSQEKSSTEGPTERASKEVARLRGDLERRLKPRFRAQWLIRLAQTAGQNEKTVRNFLYQGKRMPGWAQDLKLAAAELLGDPVPSVPELPPEIEEKDLRQLLHDILTALQPLAQVSQKLDNLPEQIAAAMRAPPSKAQRGA